MLVVDVDCLLYEVLSVSGVFFSFFSFEFFNNSHCQLVCAAVLLLYFNHVYVCVTVCITVFMYDINYSSCYILLCCSLVCSLCVFLTCVILYVEWQDCFVLGGI